MLVTVNRVSIRSDVRALTYLEEFKFTEITCDRDKEGLLKESRNFNITSTQNHAKVGQPLGHLQWVEAAVVQAGTFQ